MSTEQADSRRGAPDASWLARAGRRVVIIGGGITGLAAAWQLQMDAERRGLDVRCAVLERSDRWGGKIFSEQVTGYGDVPLTLEAGADAFLTRKPWALALARELGLADRLCGVNRANSRTFVLHRGRPTPIPEGVQLLAPTRVWPFVRSPLFSPWGKLRMGLDLLLPPRRDQSDESLAAFARRRFGAEALRTLAEPMLAGVYNAVPAEQSILATFPQYPALERQYGSVILGLRAAARARAREPVTEHMPPFVSFDTGAQALVDALIARLTGDLRLRCAVADVERDAAGGYRVRLADGDELRADAVIVATLAHDAAGLLRAVAPAAAEGLSTLRHASIGTMYLAYPRDAVPHPLDGFGLVIPSAEGRRIDGMTWTSSKWTGRAPADRALLRVFFGGPHTRDMMDLGDDELLAVVRDELVATLRVRVAPLFHRVYRWLDGYPQYDVGHLERVAAIERALPPEVRVTGSSYHGVGVPDCVRQGREAAERIMALLAAPRASEVS
ncbi:MAG TPA: protoporphyrinogen oxidase [Ktedonobacterales bacterium]